MEQQFGQITVSVEGDLIHVVRQGMWTLADVEEFISLACAVKARQGRLFVISEAAQGMTILPEARRRIGEWADSSKQIDATVIVGANFAVRTLLMLINRASELLGRNSGIMRFCATTKEARELIDRQRAKLQAEPANPSQRR